jgi:hypothetical protein
VAIAVLATAAANTKNKKKKRLISAVFSFKFQKSLAFSAKCVIMFEVFDFGENYV